MAWNALDGIAVLVEGKTLGTERHALIELDIFADDASLADDDTRAVVDGERGTNGSSGMYVHAGLGVCNLCHHAGNQGYAHRKQFVSDTENGQRLDHRVAGQYLSYACRCRITVVGCYHVGGKDAAHGRQAADEFRCHFLRLLFECFQVSEDTSVSRRFFLGIIVVVGEAHSGQNLFGKQFLQPLHVHANLIFDGFDVYL